MSRCAVFVGCVLMAALARPVSAGSDRVRVGAQVAFATEQGNLFGSGPTNRTQIFMFQPQMSVAVVHHGQWPVLELVNEATFAQSLRPQERFIMSLSEGLRLHLCPKRKLGGYLELGAGIGSSALHADPNDPTPRDAPGFRKLNGWLQFHLQVGTGLRLRVGLGSVNVGYRLTHFSNNGTQLPNLGLNLHTVVVSYQFRPF